MVWEYTAQYDMTTVIGGSSRSEKWSSPGRSRHNADQRKGRKGVVLAGRWRKAGSLKNLAGSICPCL